MKKPSRIKNRNLHLLLGVTAMGLALVFKKRKTLRNVLAGLAVVEFKNAAMRLKTPTEVDDLSNPMVYELVQSAMVGKIAMRWEEHGKEGGLPIVFVHGFPTHPRLWRYVIPRMALSGLHCLCWEMVGYGWSLSEGLKRDISVAKQAEYLHQWLVYKRIDKAIFVGHDLGGGVVQRLAVKHPELVSGLVLADSIAYDNWPITSVRAARNLSWLIEMLPTDLLKPFVISALYNLGHNNDAIRSESAEMHWHPYARSLGAKALAHQLRSINRDDTQSIGGHLRKLNVPARIVWSVYNPLSMQSGQQLSKDLKAPILIIKNGRHFSPEEHPEVIALAIKGVLIEIEELAVKH